MYIKYGRACSRENFGAWYRSYDVLRGRRKSRDVLRGNWRAKAHGNFFTVHRPTPFGASQKLQVVGRGARRSAPRSKSYLAGSRGPPAAVSQSAHGKTLSSMDLERLRCSAPFFGAALGRRDSRRTHLAKLSQVPRPPGRKGFSLCRRAVPSLPLYPRQVRTKSAHRHIGNDGSR